MSTSIRQLLRSALTLPRRIVQHDEDGFFNTHYLRRHTREPVAFLDAVRACKAEMLIHNQSLVDEVGFIPRVLVL